MEDVLLALEQMISCLKPGGLFILTSPLNFQAAKNWKYGKSIILIQQLKELGIEQIQFEDNITHTESIGCSWKSKALEYTNGMGEEKVITVRLEG